VPHLLAGEGLRQRPWAVPAPYQGRRGGPGLPVPSNSTHGDDEAPVACVSLTLSDTREDAVELETETEPALSEGMSAKILSRRDLLGVSAAALGTTAMLPQWMRVTNAVPALAPVQLAFWGGWTGPDGLAMQKLVAAFNARSRAIKVTLTLYNWDLIFDRWREAFEGGSPPDVICIHATEVAEFAMHGMLREIRAEARQALPSGDHFFPPPWRMCHVDGGLYAIPLDVHPLGLYIDARAARQAGLDPSRPPRTAGQLYEWAGRLTAAAQGRWGYAAPAGDVECFRQWYSLLYQFGGRFMDESGRRCVADSPAGVKAFTVLREMVASRRIAPPREGSVDADFIAGKIGMYLQGPWYVQGVLGAGIDLATAPAPAIGPRPAVWANSHVLGVVNTPERTRVDAAIEFIAWINDHALEWAEAGQIPAYNEARARLRTTRIWPHLRPFVAQLPTIVYQPNIVAHTKLFGENTPTPVVSEMQAVMLGTSTPFEAARAMSVQVDAVISNP